MVFPDQDGFKSFCLMQSVIDDAFVLTQGVIDGDPAGFETM
jgi:hypothetical protein